MAGTPALVGLQVAGENAHVVDLSLLKALAQPSLRELRLPFPDQLVMGRPAQKPHLRQPTLGLARQSKLSRGFLPGPAKVNGVVCDAEPHRVSPLLEPAVGGRRPAFPGLAFSVEETVRMGNVHPLQTVGFVAGRSEAPVG